MPYYTIQLHSLYTETSHEIVEAFENMKECVEFCKERYRFYLWVKINGKIVIDNSEYYKPVNK